MKTTSSLLRGALALLAGLAFSASATAQDGPRVLLGLLPVQDSSGESFSMPITKPLPAMIFERLAGHGGIEPFLLNPGGDFSPIDEDWMTEYSQTAGVNAVLVTRVTLEDRKKGTLRAEASIVDLASGRRSATMAVQEDVSKNDRAGAWRFEGATFFGSGRKFEKDRLGKVAVKLADALASLIPAELARLGSRASAPPLPAGGTCGTSFRVRYTEKNSSSKNYIVIVNGREETLGLVDGAVKLDVPSGRLVAHVSVKDAPYRLATQDSYSVSTFIDCAKPPSALVLEIGAIGQALLRQQP